MTKAASTGERSFSQDGPRWVGLINKVIGLMVSVLAALLVLAEILVLFAGVVARYAFHSPLLWSDELASIMSLWLAMRGSVVALRRGEQMRMTAFISGTALERRAF